MNPRVHDPETGSIIGTSPFMDSLIVIISIVFLVAGACYGKATGTVKNAAEGIKLITKGAKWALLAPIFIPLFLRLGIEPQSVLAAYRVADSPMNIFTPIMAYFPLIVVFAARYDKNSGIGTVIALMLPYFLIMTAVWILFFILWYVLGIPMGPGAPA